MYSFCYFSFELCRVHSLVVQMFFYCVCHFIERNWWQNVLFHIAVCSKMANIKKKRQTGQSKRREKNKKTKKKCESKSLLFWKIWLDRSGTKLDCFPAKMREKKVWNNTFKWSSLNWSTCHRERCAKSNQLESRFISTCNTSRVTRAESCLQFYLHIKTKATQNFIIILNKADALDKCRAYWCNASEPMMSCYAKTNEMQK